MNRFKRILVVVDPHCQQSHALNRAVSLALRHGATVRAIDVVSRPPSFIFSVTESAKELHEQEFANRQRHLDALIIPYRVAGKIDISNQTIRGRPAIETIREVINGQFDVVFKDVETGDRNGHGSLYSSVDKRLMRQCPCSVWLVRPDRGGTFDHVAAAIDPQPAGEMEHRLNQRILQVASSVAKYENAKLTLISVWRGSSELATIGSLYAEALVEYEERLQNDAARTLRETAQQANLDCSDYSMVLRRGEPGVTISTELKNSDVDLVVMGTLARTGIAGLFIGNTAERVLSKVTSSVLAVKANGFKLPVEIDQRIVVEFS